VRCLRFKEQFCFSCGPPQKQYPVAVGIVGVGLGEGGVVPDDAEAIEGVVLVGRGDGGEGGGRKEEENCTENRQGEDNVPEGGMYS